MMTALKGDTKKKTLKRFHIDRQFKGQHYRFVSDDEDETKVLVDVHPLNRQDTYNHCDGLIDDVDNDECDEYSDEDIGNGGSDTYEDNRSMQYGDGVDDETFESIKMKFLSLVKNICSSRKIGESDAKHYFLALVGVCSVKQRKDLTNLSSARCNALSMACQTDNLELIRFLVEECGADVDAMQGSPLMWAIQRKRLPIVEYLVKRGADVGITIETDTCMLLLAFGMGHVYLDSNGNIKECCVYTYLGDYPAQNIIRFLIDHDAVEKSNPQNLYDLLLKIIKRFAVDESKQYLPLLVNRIENVENLKSRNGDSILLNILPNGSSKLSHDENIISLFLSRVGDVNSVDIGKCFVPVPSVDTEKENVSRIVDNCFRMILKRESQGTLKSGEYMSAKLHPIIYAAYTRKIELLVPLLNHLDIPIQVKLDAVELFGACLILNDLHANGMVCWKYVDRLRTLDDIENLTVTEKINGFSLSAEVVRVLNSLLLSYRNKPLKSKLLKKTIPFPRQRFDKNVEFITLDTGSVLDFVIEGFSRLDYMTTQSALICERHLGVTNTFCFDVPIMKLADRFVKSQKPVQLASLVTLHLSCFNVYNELDKAWDTSLVLTMCQRLCEIIYKPLIRKLIDFETIIAILKCVFIVQYSKTQRSSYEHSVLPVLLLTIFKLSKLEMSGGERREFESVLSTIIRTDVRDHQKRSLLHFAVTARKNQRWINKLGEDEKVFSATLPKIGRDFDYPDFITELLLEFGADPNAFELNGQTPLHAFFSDVKVFPWYYGSERDIPLDIKRNVLDKLITSGAHADFHDSTGTTPIDLSRSTPLSLCPVKYRSLQCLAARCIVVNNIPFKDQVSHYLIDFIGLHTKH